MKVRDFLDSDAEAIARLFRGSVLKLGREAYSPDQLRVWAARGRSATGWQELARDGRAMFVAEAEDGVIAGFTNLEADGHIDHLFVAPDFARQGIASRLLDHLERHARLVDMPRLFTEASEVARPVFERQGFVVLERRDFELDGVAIHYYAMEKRLVR